MTCYVDMVKAELICNWAHPCHIFFYFDLGPVCNVKKSQLVGRVPCWFFPQYTLLHLSYLVNPLSTPSLLFSLRLCGTTHSTDLLKNSVFFRKSFRFFPESSSGKGRKNTGKKRNIFRKKADLLSFQVCTKVCFLRPTITMHSCENMVELISFLHLFFFCRTELEKARAHSPSFLQIQSIRTDA